MYYYDDDPDFIVFDERTVTHNEPIWIQYNIPVSDFMYEHDKVYLQHANEAIKAQLINELASKIKENQPVIIKFGLSVRPNPSAHTTDYRWRLLYKPVDKIEQITYSSRLSALEIARWPDAFFWKTIWHEIKTRIRKQIKNAYNRAKTFHNKYNRR